MKPKKFDKKLNLNKTTISNLYDREMKKVKGGCATKPIVSCNPSDFTACNTCTCDPTEWPGGPCCY